MYARLDPMILGQLTIRVSQATRGGLMPKWRLYPNYVCLNAPIMANCVKGALLRV